MKLDQLGDGHFFEEFLLERPAGKELKPKVIKLYYWSLTFWENALATLGLIVIKRICFVGDALSPGSPDGIFPYQNLQFWFILRGRGMEILEMVYSLCFCILWEYF